MLMIIGKKLKFDQRKITLLIEILFEVFKNCQSVFWSSSFLPLKKNWNSMNLGQVDTFRLHLQNSGFNPIVCYPTQISNPRRKNFEETAFETRFTS